MRDLDREERELFDEMIRHNVKFFTEKDSTKKAHHHKMYQFAKHALWRFQTVMRRDNG